VVATAAGKETSYTVTIDAAGVYVRDSYDFNGIQLLGYWDDSGVSRNPWGRTGVTNADFRDWRNKNSKGGDFLVFSDLKITEIKPAFVFQFT